MNHYELMMIYTPILSDEELNNAIDTYGSFIKDNGGEIVHQETWGLKQLAYPIDKKTTGIYHLFEFRAPGEVIGKLEIQFKRDDKVMRHLTTALDKHAVEYNEGRRKRLSEKKDKEKVKEEA